MVRTRQFDHADIIRMDQEGLTPAEIANVIGAKSTYHLRKIIRDHKRGIDPEWRAKQKPGVSKPEFIPLDVGKVKALQKAGWTLNDIYREFSGRYPVEQIKEAMT